jgi:hypothetical protein
MHHTRRCCYNYQSHLQSSKTNSPALLQTAKSPIFSKMPHFDFSTRIYFLELDMQANANSALSVTHSFPRFVSSAQTFHARLCHIFLIVTLTASDNHRISNDNSKHRRPLAVMSERYICNPFSMRPAPADADGN